MLPCGSLCRPQVLSEKNGRAKFQISRGHNEQQQLACIGNTDVCVLSFLLSITTVFSVMLFFD